MRPPIEDEIEAADVEVPDVHQQQTAVMLVSTRLAGNAVIRVVNRCNEAQESYNLGKPLTNASRLKRLMGGRVRGFKLVKIRIVRVNPHLLTYGSYREYGLMAPET